MSSAHRSAPHVVALALPAPKTMHARPSIFKVENLKPPKFLMAVTIEHGFNLNDGSCIRGRDIPESD